MASCNDMYGGRNNEQYGEPGAGNSVFVEPGDDLSAKYDWLKSSDRDGSMGALSSTNRRALVLAPGQYALSATLTIDTDYVGISGGNQATITRGTGGSCVKQTASIVTLSEFTIETTGTSDGQIVNGDIGFEQAAADNSGSCYIGMCFKGTAVGTRRGLPVFGTENLGGYWTNCQATGWAWRVAANKEVNAKMFSCTAWYETIGELNTAGKFGTQSFGGDTENADCSGYFWFCNTGDGGYGGCTTWGCNCSGTFIDCIAGDDSFALRRNFSGTALRCTAGKKSFGGDDGTYDGHSSEFSGIAIDCVAEGVECFGMGGTTGICSGDIIRCRVAAVNEYARGETNSSAIFDLQTTWVDATHETTMAGGNNSNILLTAATKQGRGGNEISFAILSNASPAFTAMYSATTKLITVTKGTGAGDKTATELKALLDGTPSIMAVVSVSQVGTGAGNIEAYSAQYLTGGKQPCLFTGNHPSAPTKTTATMTVPAFDNGHTYTNEGVTGAIEWDLPPAIAGMKYRFCRVDYAAGEDVTVDPNGTEHIYLEDGTDVGAGTTRGNDTTVDAYYELTVKCFKDGEWRVTNEIGYDDTTPTIWDFTGKPYNIGRWPIFDESPRQTLTAGASATFVDDAAHADGWTFDTADDTLWIGDTTTGTRIASNGGASAGFKIQTVEYDPGVLLKFTGSACTRFICSSSPTDIEGELDVSALTSLTYLNCSTNSISTLDIAALTSLTSLNCYFNSISTLDVSALTSLTSLNCSFNSISTLDVSALTSLTYLNCSTNSISTLDIAALTSLTSLNCYFNSISTLDVSALTSLTSLSCYSNSISTLDVSALTSLTSLNCSSNSISTLDVSALTSLTSLNCYSNSISTLDVSALTSLTYLNCSSDSISTLDVSALTSLAYLYCSSTNITSFSAGAFDNLDALVKVYWYDCALITAVVDLCVTDFHTDRAAKAAMTELKLAGTNEVVTGTYQAPAVPGSPANAAEAAHELVNVTGWTVEVNTA